MPDKRLKYRCKHEWKDYTFPGPFRVKWCSRCGTFVLDGKYHRPKLLVNVRNSD
jgi:hypothetical protein